MTKFVIGKRYLVREFSTLVEVTVEAMSPSGEHVKLSSPGWRGSHWEYARKWHIVEELP